MLDTLQKMSGTTHVTYRDSKTVTRDTERMFRPNDGKVSITSTTVERPVIMYNDLAFMPMRNAIVFRAGDPPIWNRNETILLMSWRLFKNTIIQPGKEYSLQTIPTLSSAAEFDVRTNQPDFFKMWEKRRDEALQAAEAKRMYQEAYGYTDYQVSRLDPDVWSDEIMEMIMTMTGRTADNAPEVERPTADPDEPDYDSIADMLCCSDDYGENEELFVATQKAQSEQDDREKGRYAGGAISREALGGLRSPSHAYDQEIIAAFKETKAHFFRDVDHFAERRGSRIDVNTGPVLIQKVDDSAALRAMRKAASEEDSRVFTEDDEAIGAQAEIGGYEVCDAFLLFLMQQDDWEGFANGAFEREMAKLVNSR